MAAAGDVATRRMAVWTRSSAVVETGNAASAVVMRSRVACGIVPPQSTAFRWSSSADGFDASVCSVARLSVMVEAVGVALKNT